MSLKIRVLVEVAEFNGPTARQGMEIDLTQVPGEIWDDIGPDEAREKVAEWLSATAMPPLLYNILRQVRLPGEPT
jgi:hypothetical protein